MGIDVNRAADKGFTQKGSGGGGSISIALVGIPELMAHMKSIEIKYKLRALKKILNYASTPLINTMKSLAPIGEQDMKGKYPHKAGNLKNSIWRVYNKNKLNPVMYVGPNRKKGFDAFYSRFVITGTSGHTIKPKSGKVLAFNTNYGSVFVRKVEHPGAKKNNFISRAYQIEFGNIYKRIKDKSIKEIQKIHKTRKKIAA